MNSAINGQPSIETDPISAAGKKRNRPIVAKTISAKGADAVTTTEAPVVAKVAPAVKPGMQKKNRRKKTTRSNGSAAETRKRGRKSYPVVGFADVLELAEGIMRHNAGLPVKRETLLGTMKLEVNALSTRNLITNSSKYGLTEGSHSAPTLKLTPKGKIAVDSKGKRIDQMKARFELAIADVPEFNSLYEKRKGSNMPAPEMLHDDLQEVDSGDRKPCADVFISNAKYLGLLTERDGAQYLMTVDEWLGASGAGWTAPTDSALPSSAGDSQATSDPAVTDYDRICFVLSTIKDTGSDERKHADMVLSQYVERALEGTGLRPVRADKIGDPGMISKQIIEHIVHSKLVLADLSFHNPNVFYELALRHVTGKPTVHLIQDSDRIPFDIGNFRTIKIDTNDKYKMVSELDTLRAEISTAIRQALANGESRDNPILTFCPNAKFVMNGQK
jgi:hypothetical protein